MWKKGQSGNPIGKGGEKIFRDSVRMSVSKVLAGDPQERRKLQAMTDKLADLACAGESWAMQMVADRLDGKAVQEVNASIEHHGELGQMSENELRAFVAGGIAAAGGSDSGVEEAAGQTGVSKARRVH